MPCTEGLLHQHMPLELPVEPSDLPRTDHLHPLLADRYSPYAFDPSVRIDDGTLNLLLEAARWAPSAGNSQPWGFLAVRPGEPDHQRVVRHLAPSSARWAPDAGLLIVTLAHRLVDDTEFAYSEFSDYDLGQAVAHLTIQAEALGLSSHQFRAFDLAGLATDFPPAPGWAIVSMIAIGAAADHPAPTRTRRPTTDLTTAPWTP
jgi:nitroreductase